jgi:hypothetical protein
VCKQIRSGGVTEWDQALGHIKYTSKRRGIPPTSKICSIPKEPDGQERERYAISAPRPVIQNELGQLKSMSIILNTVFLYLGTTTHQQEDPSGQTDAAKHP